jgi:opacity protein-like surface antigen
MAYAIENDLAVLDARIEALQKERAILEKRVKIEQLEKGNAGLRKQLGINAQAKPLNTSPRIIMRVDRPAEQPGGSYVPEAYPVFKAPGPVAPATNLTGLNVGVSFGIGRLRTSENDNDLATFTDTFSGFSSANQYQQIGAFSGQQFGGLANLTFGYDWMLFNKIIGGVQLEGGVSNIQVQQGGSFTEIDTFGDKIIVSNSDSIANRWHVSALLRGGWLISPENLIYVIGGWTYGGFEATLSSDQVFSQTLRAAESFGANGPTVGVGFETRIGPTWGVKAEYRYTKFQNATVSFPSSYVVVSPGSNQTGNISNSATFSADMHTVMFGASRYFGTY